jgi:hypothetical protein
LLLIIARSYLAPKKINNKIRSYTYPTSQKVVVTADLVAAQSEQSSITPCQSLSHRFKGKRVAGFDSTFPGRF